MKTANWAVERVLWVAATGLVVACSGTDGPGLSGDGGLDSSSPSSGGETGSGGRSSAGGSAAGGGSSGGGGAPNGSGGAAAGGAANTGGAGGGGSALDGSTEDCASTPDPCPMPSGLTRGCRQRFALGVNYAWHDFAADFGGISAWGQQSVSQNPSAIDADLAAMHDGGVSAIRWWVFPDFRGDGVSFDGSGDATGLSSVVLADVAKALELAAENDVYLVLTLFSFDNFRPDQDNSGIFVRGMAPMISDAGRRATLIENVVRPFARAAAGSPHRDHLLGWDVINEPEWAIQSTGNAPGGQDFDPNPELSAVPLATMKAFISEVAAVLKEETPYALTSAGWAAAKWSWAFQDVDIDFDQPHIYGWVDQYWPYTLSPSELGYPDRPTVMGEFHLGSMPFGTSATFGQILESWWDDGYAGAWAWQYIEGQSSLPLIADFKADKGCAAGF